jgi:hypothetical protein
MELILLSVFGIACLFALELCGLFYARWVREPQLNDSHPPAAPSADQPAGGATIRAITKQGGIAVRGRSRTQGQNQCRWLFVDDVPIERALRCGDAANDAVTTASRRVMSRDAKCDSAGE